MGMCTLELSRAGWGLNGNVHVGIVILSVVHVLQTFKMSTKGKAPASDIGQSRDEATTSTAAVNLILEGMRKMQEEIIERSAGARGGSRA